MMRAFVLSAACAAALALAACATGRIAPPDVPAALQAPAGQAAYVEALATGVQIYECTAKAGQPTAFEWVFKAPEAQLADRAGRAIGKHYAGPTWEALDGSSVVGDLKARDAGPDKAAIPWLLLSAKSHGGSGLFSTASSIQRVSTAGGIAPAQPCTAGQVARVPYTATYYFYRTAG